MADRPNAAGGPLLLWSALWGVRDEMEADYGARELDRLIKIRNREESQAN
jgi:hypothetical protein